MQDDPVAKMIASEVIGWAKLIVKLGGGDIEFVPDKPKLREQMRKYQEKKARKKEWETMT